MCRKCTKNECYSFFQVRNDMKTIDRHFEHNHKSVTSFADCIKWFFNINCAHFFKLWIFIYF